jgi:hypothetical protein
MSAKIERVARRVRGAIDLELTLEDLSRLKPGVITIGDKKYVELLDGRVKEYRSPSEILKPKRLVWTGATFVEREFGA